MEKVAIKAGVDLERVAAVFDDVGIDEARNAALAEQGVAELLGESGGVSGVGRSFGFGLGWHRQCS